jgi:hypothetical protein
MILVGLGVGRLINPLLLAYLVALGYVVLGVFEGREPVPAEAEEPEYAEPGEGRGEDPGNTGE